MRNIKGKLRDISLVSIAALVISGLAPFLASTASASTVNRVVVHLDRIKTGVASTGWVCAMPSVGTALTSYSVTFPAGFTLAAAGSWTSNNTVNNAWPASSNQLTSVTSTPASVTGQVVTWTVSQSSPLTTQYYCLNWTAGLTSTGSSGSSQSGSFVTNADTTAHGWSTAIIANDQIVVNNTTVPPIFSLTLGGNTDGFASNLINTLNTEFNSTGNTVTVQTNAANGWTVWASSANNDGTGKGTFYSTNANYKITSPSSLGTASHSYSGTGEDYGLSTSITAGNGTADAFYADGGTNKIGVLPYNTYRAIAGDTGPTAATDSAFLVKLHAAIKTQTAAATDYTDTITVVGAGLF